MVKINGRMFNNGDTVTFNKHAEMICNAPAGLKVIIHRIRNDSPISIGLYSPDKRIGSWHDFDGEVGDHRGWWIAVDELAMCIEEGKKELEVGSSFEYKGIELKGKPCRVVAQLQDGNVFVEFEEDVNGCSADGLGKTGYCIAIKPSILTSRKERKEKLSK